MNPELKTVPVSDDDRFAVAKCPHCGSENCSPTFYTDTSFDCISCGKEFDLAASPPQPVAGDEGKDFPEGVDLLSYCGADAARWAEQFRATALRLGYSDMDEGWLTTWFANAIEHADHIRHPQTLAPPPPADMKAEAEALAAWLLSPDLPSPGDVSNVLAFAERVRSAAHAAGKAEGEAAADLTGSEIISDLRNQLAAARAEALEEERRKIAAYLRQCAEDDECAVSDGVLLLLIADQVETGALSAPLPPREES